MRNNHEIDFKIFGEELQFVEIELDPDETAIGESGAMMMMDEGLLQEAKSMIPFKDTYAMQTVGYKELFDYFDGIHSLDVAVNLVKQHTRNYAKRQLTWFRRDTEMHWFDVSEPEVFNRILSLVK